MSNPPAAGHYTVNRDGDRIWVGSCASELAYHSARADILAAENTRLRAQVEEYRELLAGRVNGR